MKNRFQSIYQGWKMLACVWMIYILTGTIPSYGASVIFTHMVDLGLMDDSTVGIATSLRFTANMLLPVPTSMLIKKIGIRATMGLGAGVAGIVCLVYFFFDMPLWLYLTIFTILGGTMILSAATAAPIFANDWFEERKSLAQAILMTAGSAGGILMSPIGNTVCDFAGWRYCWMLFAIMALTAMLLSFFVLKNKPEDIGEIKDGRAWLCQHHKGTATSTSKQANDPAPVKKLLFSRQFAVTGIMVFCNRIVFSAGISYLTIHALTASFSAAEATLFLSVFNVTALLGRFLPASTDYLPIPIHIDNMIGYAVMAIGAAFLALFHAPTLFIAGCLLLGLGTGYTYGMFPISIPKHFGSANFASVFGMQSTIGYAGGVLSPILFMVLAHITAGYSAGYAIIAITSVICAVLSLFTPACPDKFTHLHIYDGHDKHEYHPSV